MRLALTITAVLALALPAQADVRGEFVDYRHRDVKVTGYLAYDDSVKTIRPGVLVVQDWMGEGEFDRDVCRRPAVPGYAAFGADNCGKGLPPAAGRHNSRFAACNPGADRRSWAAMELFLAEIFRKK